MARPPAIFVGDAPGLDFLNSIATPVDAPIDWIDDGEGFASWLEQARLVSVDALTSIRAHALPGELDKVADQARSLREWFRGFVREHKGRALAAGDLVQFEPLNRLLERDESFSRIVPQFGGGSEPFELLMARRWRTPEALLLPIGEALAQLICTEDFSHIKACEGPACTLLFADHTRGHARRWCSMALCGNRAKQAAHRHRAKAHRVQLEDSGF
ncbi:ABATE domain-containing protein [Methylocapsa sp. S129]|uniref:CGNR zinc finger domain-containing protein n=1 Tax=Methylocapsa sp. S129 TaxID=1641869 RepID=UPI00131E92C7|nr:ABATE domain-containing protein [Methylocapsa sp. S129]